MFLGRTDKAALPRTGPEDVSIVGRLTFPPKPATAWPREGRGRFREELAERMALHAASVRVRDAFGVETEYTHFADVHLRQSGSERSPFGRKPDAPPPHEVPEIASNIIQLEFPAGTRAA